MSIPLSSDNLLNYGIRDSKSRHDWREHCRQLMTKFSDAQKSCYSEAIAQRLESYIVQSGASVVAVYWPIRDEPKLLLLWERLRKVGFQLALPKVLAKDEPLSFSFWQPDSKLLLSQWGIAEIDGPTIALDDLELMVMPCVGYWQSGHRLGYGGGFYDRTLMQWRRLPNRSKSKRIAVAVAYDECALPESLALLETDQKCEVILTPNQTIFSGISGVSSIPA